MTGPMSDDDVVGVASQDQSQERGFLPELLKLAEMIEGLYFGDDTMPEALPDTLRRMIGEMEARIKAQDFILFPAIRNGGVA